MLSVKEIKETMETGKVITGVKFQNQLAFDLVNDNATLQGGRKYVTIPMELLEIDESYQRIDCINMNKVRSLIKNFDIDKCDPILVAPHPETCTFSVINGSHRLLAFNEKGIKKIGAVIADDLPEDPKKRRIKEARLFCEQDIEVDRLSQAHKHKAYCLMGVKRNLILEKCIKGRKLVIDNNILKNKGEEKCEQLKSDGYRFITGYSDMLVAAANSRGEELVNTILDIIEKAGWRNLPNGYASYTIRPIAAVINLHNFDPNVTQAIINVLSRTEPNSFYSDADAAYKSRSNRKEIYTMYLEREVADEMGVEPIYTGGDRRKITSKYNRAKRNASASDKTTPFPTTGTEN